MPGAVRPVSYTQLDVYKRQALCRLEENAQVICGDSVASLGAQRQKFDIIFLDPPYGSGLL